MDPNLLRLRSRRHGFQIPVTEVSDSPSDRDELVSDLAVRAEEQLRARSQAQGSSLLHRGYDEALDIIANIQNPTTTINLVEYLVPSSMVASINKVAVFYSNPLVPMGIAVGWRVTVNGGRVPGMRNDTDEYHFSSYGDINRPNEIEPVWVQAGQTIAIEIEPRFGFAENLTMIGRLVGRLYKIATGGSDGI